MAPPGSRLQKARVLILSADYATAVRVQDALRDECETEVRATAERLAHRFAFDLVVMFSQLPALDAVLAQKVPVIVLALPEAVVRAQTLAAGRAAVVEVPFTKERLLACVQQLVGAYVQPW
jgi:DNA-binding response OmpR family regulator